MKLFLIFVMVMWFILLVVQSLFKLVATSNYSLFIFVRGLF